MTVEEFIESLPSLATSKLLLFMTSTEAASELVYALSGLKSDSLGPTNVAAAEAIALIWPKLTAEVDRRFPVTK